MANLDDFDLDPSRKRRELDGLGEGSEPDLGRSDLAPSLDRGSLPIVPIVAGVAILGLAAGAAFFLLKPGRGVRTAETRVATTPPPLASVSPSAEAVSLPSLDASDDFVRELLRGLSAHPQLGVWMGQSGLLRSFVQGVQTVSEGRSPAPLVRFLTPSKPFGVIQKGTRQLADPRSYAAYDDLADAVASLDAAAAARAFRLVLPLLSAAYREIGFPDRDFSVTFAEAIGELLQAPVLEGDVYFKSGPLFVQYAEPRLEGLSLAQKQLLRTGPRNVTLIQAKLRELARELGLRLPQ